MSGRTAEAVGPVDKINPKLDLVLERTIEVPPELVWQAWTKPQHLRHWFCPKPWGVDECEIDLRPGGIFRFRQVGPEGEKIDITGCYLEVEENRRLVWTLALLPGYRPRTDAFLWFTAKILIEPHLGSKGGGTKYTAIAMHRTDEEAESHLAMGFKDGWSTALDQLVAYAKDKLTH